MANGQRNLAFLLDGDFRQSLRGPVQIKVHYRDKTVAAWTVPATSGGATTELGTVRGRGDGVWRTATFACTVPFAPGALGDGVAFVVHARDGGDVTVRYVRVIR